MKVRCNRGTNTGHIRYISNYCVTSDLFSPFYLDIFKMKVSTPPFIFIIFVFNKNLPIGSISITSFSISLRYNAWCNCIYRLSIIGIMIWII